MAKRRESITLDKLHFHEGRLYGRAEEEKTLIDIYKKVINNHENDSVEELSQLALISGYSGTGKSSLVASLRSKVAKRGDYFISGKFDLLMRSIPYAAIVDALSDLVGQMDRGRRKSILRNRVGVEVSNVIVNCVPELRGLLFDDHGEAAKEVPLTQALGSVESRNQFTFAFRSFIRNVCEHSGKVMVLFIDDLHWADPASLELIEVLATDKENPSLLVIGSYRDNEVDQTHALSARIREIERSEKVDITRLPIGNLSVDVVNNLIADTTNMAVTETQSLAEVVHKKTHGNVFFVIQLVKALADEGLMEFNFGTFQWSWNLDDINAKYSVTSNVVDLLLEKMRRIKVENRQVLLLSSCLGSSFDLAIVILVVDYLQEIMTSSSSPLNSKETLSFLQLSTDNVEPSIEEILAEGLLEKTSRFRDDSFRFSHDHIKQAAFGLIPEESRELLQWYIGQALVNKLPSDRLSQVLFCAVDLLNSGLDSYSSSHSENNQELLKIAQLNLGAGKKALSVSAFRQSASYLETSIKCIEQVSGRMDMAWIQHHDFCLSACQAAADCAYVSSDYTLMHKYIDSILKYTHTKEGKMAAYSTLVESYSARDRFREAFDSAFMALAEIGETFPRNPSKITVVAQLVKMKKLMKEYPMQRLRELPLLADRPRAIMQKIFVRLSTQAWLEFPNYLPLMIFRMVKWSCNYGICGASPPAFALYGLLTTGILKDPKKGYDYAVFAMEMMERLNDKSEYAYTCTVAAMVKTNQTPVINAMKEGLIGYQIGMQHGENYHAMLNLVHRMSMSFLAGQALPIVEADMRLYVPHFADHGQMTCYKRFLPCWQLVLILIGNSPDGKEIEVTTCELTGELMNERSYLEQLPGQKPPLLVYKLFLAYYLGYYCKAASLAEETKGFGEKAVLGHFLGVRYTFFEGLVACAMLSELKGTFQPSKWRKRKSKSIRKMVAMANKGNVNVNHMVLLLRAEEHVLRKNVDLKSARSKYDEAISAASRAGFANDSALANERAGVFCVKRGDETWASIYIQRAHQRWSEYGAFAICRQLEKRYPQYITQSVRKSSRMSFNQQQKRFRRQSKNKKTIMFRDPSEHFSAMKTSSLSADAALKSSTESNDGEYFRSSIMKDKTSSSISSSSHSHSGEQWSVQ